MPGWAKAVQGYGAVVNAPYTTWGAGGANRARKNSVNTQVRTWRMTICTSWYTIASSSSVGHSEALIELE